MEWILQQEGSLGTILLMAILVVGLLYLLLPVFIWRIWHWSHQNSNHLKDLNAKLELLIRQIAPEALPPIEMPAPAPATPGQEETAETTESEGSGEDAGFLPGSDFEGDLSDNDSMEFSMADQFEDLSDDLADSEISDFTDKEEDEEFAGDFSDLDRDDSAGEGDTDDELVMDFDDEGDDGTRQEEDLFSESDADESDAQDEDDEFSFGDNESAIPSEIPVTDSDPSDFTVEHFDSNEEKSFEFEDVDDDSFEGREDSFSEEELASDDVTDKEADEEKSWGESSTDDIWGEESTEETDEEFSFGEESDLGAAFDEPAEEEQESVGDVANSFLSDLEKKLNLDDIASQPAAAPKPPPTPQPEPPKPAPPAPKPEAAESQATLFARCEGCGHKLAYKQSLSGKRVRCPACRTAFALP